MTTKSKQEAMDGSPATVVRTIMDLAGTGKFSEYDHRQDPGENPEYIRIQFQCGPIKEVGVNGCAIEDVIDVLVERLMGFQRGPFACEENVEALYGLSLAKRVLEERTAKRQAQGVEGTNAGHRDAP